jgi:two-component system, NarL family, nitrate/nitrite response regulator NarL
MEGLRRLLESADGLSLIATETSLVDGIRVVHECQPTVLILYKALGSHAVTDWLALLKRMPGRPAAMVWGGSLNEAEALRFLHAGAMGVVRKTARLEAILTCIRTVAVGGTWMEDEMLHEPERVAQTRRSPLTTREAQVMDLVEQGMKNKEVALALGIRVGTVKIHLKHIFEKTGIRGRYGLALSGLKEKGLLQAVI